MNEKKKVNSKTVSIVIFLIVILVGPLFVQGILNKSNVMQQIVSPEGSSSEIPTGDRAAREFLTYEWQDPLAYSEGERYHITTDLQQSDFSRTHYDMPDSIDRNDTTGPLVLSGDVVLHESNISDDSLQNQDWPWLSQFNLEADTNLLSISRLDQEEHRRWPWEKDDNKAKGFAAPVLCPVKESNWFHKKSYSVLSFDAEFERDYGAGSEDLWIWIWIRPDQDTYSRYIYVKWDGVSVGSFIVRPWSDMKGYVRISRATYSHLMDIGHHTLEVALTYGGYIARPYKLMYIWPGIGSSSSSSSQTPPLNEDSGAPPYSGEGPKGPSEFCQFSTRIDSGTSPWMEFQVYAGTDTHVNIVTENWADTGSRSLVLTWDYTRHWYLTAPGAYDIHIGDETDDSIHVLELVFDMPAVDFGKRIKVLAVHHEGWDVEIDSMSGLDYSTLGSAVSLTQAYYKTHGYHRMEYVIDDTSISFDTTTTDSEFNTLRNNYFDHKDQSGWTWMMLLNQLTGSPDPPVGAYYPGKGIAIPQETIDDERYLDGGTRLEWMTMVFMHEFGHSIDIFVLKGWWPFWLEEDYCSTANCVMSYAEADNTRYHDQWYCFYHWRLRNKK